MHRHSLHSSRLQMAELQKAGPNWVELLYQGYRFVDRPNAGMQREPEREQVRSRSNGKTDIAEGSSITEMLDTGNLTFSTIL